MSKQITFYIAVILLASCAQVPQQSVELSATVGRDIVQVYETHKKTTEILFQRMKNDINTFVDDVYAPYQIGLLLEADLKDFQNGDANSLMYSINEAGTHTNEAGKQKIALEYMQEFVEFVSEDIEAYREELLRPVEQQEEETLLAIDRSYNQIIYANAIVTGHLASVRKVHDAQEDILNQFGLENLREKTADKLSSASDKISETLKNAKAVDTDKIEEQLKEVKLQMDKVFK